MLRGRLPPVANRVLTAVITGGPSKSFTYDKTGNILTKSDVGGTYCYVSAPG